MGVLFAYSIVGSVVLLFGYIAYRLFMARQCQPVLNRVALMSIYVVAAFSFFIYNNVEWGSAGATPVAAAINIEIGDISAAVTQTGATPWILSLLLAIYVLGVLAVAVYSLWAYIRVAALISGGEKTRYSSYTVVLVHGCEVPFSIGHYIVMDAGEPDADREMIILHESAHLRARHWVDLLIAQAECTLMWYNPATWLMRSALRQVHEYQADGDVIASGADTYQYQMLLIRKAAGRRLQSVANSLNHSNLSIRITMMYKKRSSAVRRLGAAAIVPAMVAAMFVVRQPALASTIGAISDATLNTTEGLGPVKSHSAGKDTKNSGIRVDSVAPATLPQYPGGEAAMMQYMVKTMRYPADAADAGKEGKVVVAFTVAADGAVVDPHVTQSVWPSLDAEAVRVVASMPNFIPARNKQGQPVACSFVIPVNYRLAPSAKKSDASAVRVVAVGEAEKGSGEPVVIAINKEGKKASGTPAVFVDGVRCDKDLNSIAPSSIKSITVKKDEPEYPDGVIYILLKHEDKSKE